MNGLGYQDFIGYNRLKEEEERKRARGISPFAFQDDYMINQVMAREPMTGIEQGQPIKPQDNFNMSIPQAPQPVKLKVDQAEALRKMQQKKQPQGLFDKISSGISDITSAPNFNDKLILAMQGLTMNPNQAAIQMAQDNIKQTKGLQQLKKDTNATVNYLRQIGANREADIIEANPRMAKTVLSQVQAQQKSKQDIETVLGKEQAKDMSEAISAMPSTERLIQQGLNAVDQVLSIDTKELDTVLGPVTSRFPTFSEDSALTESKLDQLESQAFINAFESLKGAGTITEAEGAAAASALGRLQRGLSGDEYKKAATEFKDTLMTILESARVKAGKQKSSVNQFRQSNTPQVDFSGFSIIGGESEVNNAS